MNAKSTRESNLLKMLRFLVDNDGVRYVASRIGDEIWPESMGRGNAPHARTAGKLLKWAKGLGLVHDSLDEHGRYWTFTRAGKRYLEEHQ